MSTGKTVVCSFGPSRLLNKEENKQLKDFIKDNESRMLITISNPQYFNINNYGTTKGN